MNAILPAVGKEFTFTHFQLFCGLGGTAKGFNRGKSRVGGIEGRFRCVGGIDVDPASIRDFTRLAGVEGTVLDLFDHEQYVDFHGRQPPSGWREATPADVRDAAHGEFPDIVFLSAPCKGFSGLLGETQSKTAKYQALNRLTLRGVWLMLEAFKDDLPKLIGFENVPRIAKRGRYLLDQICALLRSYGYAVSETTHDCGVLGGLGQSRKRFLLVARHEVKVPPFLWEPPKRSLRGVGEILEKLPLPGDPLGGAMHRMPALQWKTWVRLAFVEAGSDWRSLNKLAIENGHLRDFGIMPEGAWRDDIMGVLPWGATSGTATGKAGATTGRFNVADPRGLADPHNGSYGVEGWDDSAGVVTSNGRPASGRFSVADPRFEGLDYKQYGVRRWGQTMGAVINVKAPGQGVFSVADPRYGEKPHFSNVFRLVEWDREAGAISAGQGPTSGGQAVADPRPAGLQPGREAFETGGHYGVVPWAGSSRAVPGFAKNNNGPWSVADPRDVPPEPLLELPKAEDRLVAVIRALDGTWHRPFTTLELAALQSLVDPDEPLVLDGTSDSAWRERIGNAVPPDAAEAIASVMATTLLLAMTGATFMLSSEPIWVRPFAVALSIDHSPNDGMLD